LACLALGFDYHKPSLRILQGLIFGILDVKLAAVLSWRPEAQMM
jgi:hypothetical protein